MEYITCSCRKTSKCLTSTCECRDSALHCTDLCKCSGCENEENVENKKRNYSDIDSDDEDEFIETILRSSRPDVFCKKAVLKNFTKFTGKHLCLSVFFNNKVAGLGPATLSKKRLWHRCFSVNFVKFLKNSFLTKHLLWLLLTTSKTKPDIYCHHDFRRLCTSNFRKLKNLAKILKGQGIIEESQDLLLK